MGVEQRADAMRTDVARRELEARCSSLQSELYQRGATMSLTSLEILCRRLHLTELKLHSFKGINYGKEK